MTTHPTLIKKLQPPIIKFVSGLTQEDSVVEPVNPVKYPDGQESQALCPNSAANEFSGHGVQYPLPGLEYSPLLQGSQYFDLKPENVPAGQISQVLFPGIKIYFEPGGHRGITEGLLLGAVVGFEVG